MARAHAGLDNFTDYLRNKFAWKEDYVCKTDKIDQTFSYHEVLQALNYLKSTDPELHKLLQYRYLTARKRDIIATSLYMDPSTLKRKWDKAMGIVQNWLIHGPIKSNEDPLFVELEPIKSIIEN